MHRLINRSIQCFLRDTYGPALWSEVAKKAGLGFDSFEVMLNYDLHLTEAVISAAARTLDRPRETVLEDLGTYLVSHSTTEALRRLLRFGGVTYVDFLHSLEDLPDRARLVLPDLDLPVIALTDHSVDSFSLSCGNILPGLGHVIVGLLRAIADDYGALVLIDHAGCGPEGETVSVLLLEQGFAAGRHFDISARVG